MKYGNAIVCLVLVAVGGWVAALAAPQVFDHIIAMVSCWSGFAC